MVKNPPTNAGAARAMGSIPGSGSLQKEMAIHSSILTWKIHGQKSLAGYSPWVQKKPDVNEQLSILHNCLKEW